jgi:hypothetical protein
VNIHRLLAQSTVSDLGVARGWYSRLFEREPDAEPMDGLIEWHLAETFGVQVWAEPDRAGRGCMLLDVPDLDALSARLTAAGITDGGPEPVTSSRILRIEDPDGNRLVFTGP